MNGRDAAGRFTTGNEYAGQGGRARAATLTKEQRAAIARLGWEAVVVKRFNGDREQARKWFGQLGAWASDAYRDVFPVFEHPGPMPGGGDV